MAKPFHPDPQKQPALYNSIPARNPFGDGQISAFVPKAMLRGVGKASAARIRNLALIVPEALLKAHAIYNPGREEFVYAYRAGSIHVNHDEGLLGPAKKASDDELFLVYLDRNFVLLDWKAERGGVWIGDVLVPKDFLRRFGQRL